MVAEDTSGSSPALRAAPLRKGASFGPGGGAARRSAPTTLTKITGELHPMTCFASMMHWCGSHWSCKLNCHEPLACRISDTTTGAAQRPMDTYTQAAWAPQHQQQLADAFWSRNMHIRPHM